MGPPLDWGCKVGGGPAGGGAVDGRLRPSNLGSGPAAIKSV